MRRARSRSRSRAAPSASASGAYSRSVLSAMAPSFDTVSGPNRCAPPYTVCTGCRRGVCVSAMLESLTADCRLPTADCGYDMRAQLMVTTAAAPHPVMTREQRVNQRNAVLAGFLGWTLDAFDFFVLTFVIQDVATAFGKTRPDIALTVSLALVTRPIGAVIFGLIADRYGRRLPLMLNVIFYAVISVLSGLAPNYTDVRDPASAVRDRHGRRVGRRRVARARVGVAAVARPAVGAAAGRLRAGQSAGRAGVPHRLRARSRQPPRGCVARHVLPRRPARAALALHPRARQGIGGLEGTPDGLDDLPPVDLAALAAVRVSRPADDDDGRSCRTARRTCTRRSCSS